MEEEQGLFKANAVNEREREREEEEVVVVEVLLTERECVRV